MATSFMSPLCCAAVSGEGTHKNEILSESLEQETGKKSSFLFNPREPLRIPKPAHLFIDHSVPSSKDSPKIYFLGGFQIVSNARHSEVYLTDKDGKEEYLMTSKGIPFEKGTSGEEEWYKAVCVVPGGPRPILGLHMKLLSLKPASETAAKVKSCKITARIPEAPSTAPKYEQETVGNTTESDKSTNGRSSSTPTTAPSNRTSSQDASVGITQTDLGAAMASVSILARSTESQIENAMTERFNALGNLVQTRFTSLEQHILSLTTVASSQKTTLEEQTKLLKMQQSMMKAQSDQINSLLEQQTTMAQTVKDIQAELLAFRQEVKDENAKAVRRPPPIPRIPKHPPPIDEEPVERGIEQTLSNLDRSENDEDDEDEKSDIFAAVELRSISLSKAAQLHLSKPTKGNKPIPVEESEKIEVSLLDGETESMHVHEEKVEEPLLVDESTPSGTSLGHVPKIARSFEDRNDKNDAKEAEIETSDKVELEVMTGHDDRTIEVLESTTADEQERSPPEVSEANLIDL